MDLYFLEDGRFLWTSERDGWRHLYLYGADGGLQKRLTSGEWQIENVYGVNELQDAAFIQANLNDPRQRHIYRVGLNDGALELLGLVLVLGAGALEQKGVELGAADRVLARGVPDRQRAPVQAQGLEGQQAMGIVFGRKFEVAQDLRRHPSRAQLEARKGRLVEHDHVETGVTQFPGAGGAGRPTADDDGVGLPEDLDFRHTDSLGLSLVNTLVNQLNGEIELERDVGTAFEITFLLR